MFPVGQADVVAFTREDAFDVAGQLSNQGIVGGGPVQGQHRSLVIQREASILWPRHQSARRSDVTATCSLTPRGPAALGR